MTTSKGTKDHVSISHSFGIDWTHEIKLEPALSHLPAPALLQPTDGLVVALTGASGFLGLELLSRLVNSVKVKAVHALAVRSLEKLGHISSPKLSIYAGELGQPGLGMTDDAIEHVFKTSHIVIHNGADVAFLKPYSSLRRTNFESTKIILRLALEHGHVRHFHYVSSAAVASLLDGDLYEESPQSLQLVQTHGNNSNGYFLSKWASELYLERASAATGMPVTIHRPTLIVGENAPHFDLMSSILHYSKQMHAVPSMSAMDGSFQFVHVEDVASAIISSVYAGDHGHELGTGPARVYWNNHTGLPEDTIDVKGFAPYISKIIQKDVSVVPDAEWTAKATAIGMPSGVAACFMELTTLYKYTGSGKLVIRRTLNGARP